MSLSALEKRLNELVDIFDQLYEESLKRISLDNITLKEALVNQIPLMLDWEIVVKELNYIHDQCLDEVDSCYALAIKTLMNDAYKSLSISEAKEYAKADLSYRNAKSLYNKIKQKRDEAKSMMDVIDSRKYILNNLTNAIVSSNENHIL